MSKFVPDASSARWVIIASHRTARPDQTIKSDERCDLCPFCAGNEALTPNETYRIGEGEADKSGWEVRVIPNKYPITDQHEVIIHAPDDTKDLHELPLEHIAKVFQAYKQRFNFYKENGQVLIFCNRGEHAGASVKHPHSQLVVIPAQINLDTLVREPLNNLVEEHEFFNIYCPDFSQWPYEVWIAPKADGGLFGDITDEQIQDLAKLYQKILKRLEDVHKRENLTKHEFGYNFYIHPKENWYLRIIPRFIHRAGFELGTGLSVNVVDPATAAKELRSKEDEIEELMDKLKKLQK
ncbi:MAG: hypothetical protein ACEQSA_02620 [Weeksellaceae bacterium]